MVKGESNMPLVEAKCVNCGGLLEVDNSNESAVCKYCGTTFIVEKAINNYIQNISIQNATINIQGPEVDNFIQLIEDALNRGDYKEAEKYMHNALTLDPQNMKLAFFQQKINNFYFLDLHLLQVESAIEEYKTLESTILNPVTRNERRNEIKRLWADWWNTKFVDKEFLDFTNGVIDNCQNRFSLEDTIKADYCWDVFEIYNRCLEVCDYLEHFFSSSNDDYNKFHLDWGNLFGKMSCVENEIYRLLISPLIPIEVIDKELNILIQLEKRKNGVTHRFIGGSIPYELIDKNEKVLAKDKKGNDKEAKRFGSYIIYYIRKNHPEFESTAIDEIQQMVADREKKGCYVATCVYGSYDCPEVWTLRRYRDYTLDKTWYGRAFIKIYYAISPTAVKYFGDYEWFKNFLKCPLDKMINTLSKKGYENTPYEDKY